MKTHFLTLFVVIALLLATLSGAFAQMGISNNGSSPDSSAMLDVKSTTKGFLAPRMTAAERDAITRPANGLLVFCTDNNQYYYNMGTSETKNWVMLNTQWKSSGLNLYYNSGNVGVGTSSPSYLLHIVGGDVKIGNTSGDARKLYFGDGGNVYVGEEATDNRLGLLGNSLMISIGGSTGSNGQVLTSNGTTCSWITPSATGTGIADYIARWTAPGTLGTGLIRDNNTSVGINTAPDGNYRLKVDGAGSWAAVYGQYNADHYGYLGNLNYGVYGQYDANRLGYMGNPNYGVYGQYNTNHYGYLGSNDYGVYGRYDGNHYGYFGGALYMEPPGLSRAEQAQVSMDTVLPTRPGHQLFTGIMVHQRTELHIRYPTQRMESWVIRIGELLIILGFSERGMMIQEGLRRSDRNRKFF